MTKSAAHFRYATLLCLALLIGTAALVLCPKSLTADAPKEPDFGLPELYKINSVTLQSSYDCRSPKSLNPEYQMNPLFASRFSRDHNAPDMLFSASCHSSDVFRAAVARDSMTLLEDMGDLNLEGVNAAVALSTLDSRIYHFARSVRVFQSHTYVVLVNDSDRRGLIAFTVLNYAPREKVDLQYAVLQYQILNVRSQSPSFGWGKSGIAEDNTSLYHLSSPAPWRHPSGSLPKKLISSP